MDGKKKIIQILFISTVVLSSVSYLPHALICIKEGIPVLFAFSGYPDGMFYKAFRFLKEAALIITFVAIILDGYLKKGIEKNNVSKSILPVALLVICEGTASLIFADEFSINMVIAGIRPMIYLITPLMFAFNYDDPTFKFRFYKVLNLLLFIQFGVSAAQLIVTRQVYGIWGIGTMRMPGAYGSAGNLSTFAIMYSIYIFMLFHEYKAFKNLDYLLKQLIALLLCILTGTRLCIALVSLLLLVSLFYMLLKKGLDNGREDAFIAVAALILTPVFLRMAEGIAQRGNALLSQIEGGRFFVIYDYLANSSIKEILFGVGIGYGTNTAMNMIYQLNFGNVDSAIMDGTFNTIITQFGLLIFSLIFGLILLVLRNAFLKYRDRLLYISVIMMVMLAVTLSGNMLEHDTYILIFGYALKLLCSPAEEKKKGI